MVARNARRCFCLRSGSGCALLTLRCLQALHRDPRNWNGDDNPHERRSQPHRHPPQPVVGPIVFLGALAFDLGAALVGLGPLFLCLGPAALLVGERVRLCQLALPRCLPLTFRPFGVRSTCAHELSLDLVQVVEALCCRERRAAQ